MISRYHLFDSTIGSVFNLLYDFWLSFAFISLLRGALLNHEHGLAYRKEQISVHSPRSIKFYFVPSKCSFDLQNDNCEDRTLCAHDTCRKLTHFADS